MDDPGYAYLYCELLNQVGLTMITLWVKSPHIQMHENVLQKGLYIKVENFGIEVRSQRGFEKREIPIILVVESTTILSLQHLNLFWFQCFSILIFSKNLNLGHSIPDALPTPQRTQRWVQMKHSGSGRRRSRSALPSSQHFEG